MSLVNRSKTNPISFLRAALGLLTGVTLLAILFYRGTLKDKIDTVYEEPPPYEVLQNSKLKFSEVAKSVGIDNFNEIYSPNPKIRAIDRDLTLGALHPSVAIVDINNDGFMDIYIATATDKPNLLYVNQGGNSFAEQAEKYGIAGENQIFPSGPPVFADFNGDGKLDLLMSKQGQHKFFLRSKTGDFFIDKSEQLGGYHSNPHAVNVFDYDRDGKLDLIFGNYFNDVDIRKRRPSSFVWGTRNDKNNGGKNHILKNIGDSFISVPIDFKYFNFTNTIGVIDINQDSWPDLFVGNDYATDEMWLNRQGRTFREVTRSYIPTAEHGYAGMNSEVVDYNEDGLQDLYVSNIYKAPYANNRNLLWTNKGDGFKQDSKELGVAKCGFSWGAKFSDFDHDGDLDLMVVNGRARGKDVLSPNDGRSYWHERTVIGHTPLFMRKFFIDHYSNGSQKIYVSSFERSCLFERVNEKFYDVAENSGIQDLEDGKGLALVDYDNDGKLDLVVVNNGGPTLVYHNKSQTVGQWIGFSLISKQGTTIPVGAQTKLFVNDSQKALVRSLYPNNGYNSQSDPRIHYGLGQQIPTSLEVTWPDGSKETYKDLKVNTYQAIAQGKGSSL